MGPMLLILGCTGGADYSLNLIPVIPDNQSPFSQADRIDLVLEPEDGEELVYTLDGTSGSPSLDQLPALARTSISVRAYDRDELVAFGRSRPFTLEEGENEQQVLVSETNNMGWLTSMGTELGGSAVAAHNGSFYIFGGETEILDFFNNEQGVGLATIWRMDIAPAGALEAEALEVSLPEHSKGGNTWAGATATNIGDGKILVAGGSPWFDAVGEAALFDAFIFDAREETVGSPFELIVSRTLHQAVTFSNGDVALIGGLLADGQGALAVELYRPDSGITETGGKHSASMPSAASLGAGGVLICGGYINTSPQADCEILSINGSIQAVASLPAARDGLTLASVGEGRVLAVGGADASTSAQDNAWLYDQDSDTWISVGSLNVARALHRAVTLPNGQVLIMGGASAARRNLPAWEDGVGVVGQAISCVELYDPETQEFTVLNDCSIDDEAAGLPERSAYPSVALDPDHGVLVVGGFALVEDLPPVPGVSFFPAIP